MNKLLLPFVAMLLVSCGSSVETIEDRPYAMGYHDCMEGYTQLKEWKKRKEFCDSLVGY